MSRLKSRRTLASAVASRLTRLVTEAQRKEGICPGPCPGAGLQLRGGFQTPAGTEQEALSAPQPKWRYSQAERQPPTPTRQSKRSEKRRATLETPAGVGVPEAVQAAGRGERSQPAQAEPPARASRQAPAATQGETSGLPEASVTQARLQSCRGWCLEAKRVLWAHPLGPLLRQQQVDAMAALSLPSPCKLPTAHHAFW